MTSYRMSTTTGQGTVTVHLDLRIDHFDFDALWTTPNLIAAANDDGLTVEVNAESGKFEVFFPDLNRWDLLSPAFSWSQPVGLAGNAPGSGYSHDVQVSQDIGFNRYLGSPQSQASGRIDSGGNAGSSAGGLSWDGRWSVFASQASNLVDGDSNGHADVFMHDGRTGRTERLSVSVTGVQGDADATGAAVSAFANAVAFQSSATNLVDGRSLGGQQVYLKWLDGGAVDLVSAAADGSLGNGASRDAALSADAGVVAFTSEASNLVAGDTNGHADVFVRRDGSSTLLDLSAGGNGDSGHAQVSSDGRWVVFESDASNLLAGDDNGQRDIFLCDLDSGSLQRVSQTAGGGGADGTSRDASVSADGRYVVFTSDADNLVAGDTNGAADVFRRDMQTGNVVRVSVASDGSQADGASASRLSVSGDGRFVLFASAADNLVAGDTDGLTNAFIKDLQSGRIARVPDGAGASPALSANGSQLLYLDAGGHVVSGSNPIDSHRLLGTQATDVFYAGSPLDELVGDPVNGFQYDSLHCYADFALPDGMISADLLGSAAADLTGNAARNVLEGNDGDNVLDGRGGGDYMYGGRGNDTYYVDDASDIVYEGELADYGTHDVVWASVDVTTFGVEEVRLLGTDDLDITDRDSLWGDGHGSLLVGNAGNNVLRVVSWIPSDDTIQGGDGNDTLAGGQGDNVLEGGAGNDTYMLSNGTDQVVELLDGGLDTIITRHGRTLALHEERLLLTFHANPGEDDRQASGNAGANLLMGGAGADTLDGGGGFDMVSYNGATLWMSSGVSVDLGAGTASGGMGLDRLVNLEGVIGSRHADTLIGDAASNLLFGNLGADTLTGGGGADRFVLRGLDAADLVTDFDTSLDLLLVSMKGLSVGNGDLSIDHGTETAGTGGFGSDAELVVLTTAVAGTLDAASVAAAIGGASSAYAMGDERVFVVGNGSQTSVWHFKSDGADAAVGAAELTLMGLLETPQQLHLDDLRWAV